MMKTVIAVLLAAVFAAVTSNVLAAGPWELTGSWRLNVKCRNFDQVNNLTIGSATAKRVTGTTNVNDGFGKIDKGQFDGVNFVFNNKYRFQGRSYTEVWKGKLSDNGRRMRGAFTTTHTAAGGCSFSGSRR